MTGHFPYGIHLLAGRPADYLIVLRDPIERSLSFFEFVTGDRSGHPLRQVAENGGLAGLHQNPILRNLQTQFAAGWIGERRNIGIPHRLEDAVLTRAKRNLERRYAWVGFVETFDRSTQVLAGQFDWPLPPIGNFNKNLNRRSAGDLDHDDLRALREANELDRRLYDWAFERFGR
jgi:hypothetical protein